MVRSDFPWLLAKIIEAYTMTSRCRRRWEGDGERKKGEEEEGKSGCEGLYQRTKDGKRRRECKKNRERENQQRMSCWKMMSPLHISLLRLTEGYVFIINSCFLYMPLCIAPVCLGLLLSIFKSPNAFLPRIQRTTQPKQHQEGQNSSRHLSVSVFF